jgi:hypothetical protein
LGKYGVDTEEVINGTSEQPVVENQNVKQTANSTDSEDAESGFSVAGLFPTGELGTGIKVLNKETLDVHKNPNGQILGQQEKYKTGQIIAGPKTAGNEKWWRIDYKDAPDGWVSSGFLTSYIWTYRLLHSFPIVFTSIKPFLILLSIILVILILIVMFKLKNLEKDIAHKKSFEKEKEIEAQRTIEEIPADDPIIANLPTNSDAPITEDVHNKRWVNVQTLINSHNVNDWKQAILEADIILDEMLEKMGYQGESIGAKLKQIESSDFMTLNQAWEAHKMRNRIAHKGTQFVLTRGDAERARVLFRSQENQIHQFSPRYKFRQGLATID